MRPRMESEEDASPAGEDRIRELALACAVGAIEKKAFDVRILDVQGLTSIADYFVLCSGRSDTQVRTIAEGVEQACRHVGRRPLSVEGASLGKWILVDFGDVLVHVFHEPVREFYDLERLWAKARVVELPEDLALASAAGAPGGPSRHDDDAPALTDPSLS